MDTLAVATLNHRTDHGEIGKPLSRLLCVRKKSLDALCELVSAESVRYSIELMMQRRMRRRRLYGNCYLILSNIQVSSHASSAHMLFHCYPLMDKHIRNRCLKCCCREYVALIKNRCEKWLVDWAKRHWHLSHNFTHYLIRQLSRDLIFFCKISRFNITIEGY